MKIVDQECKDWIYQARKQLINTVLEKIDTNQTPHKVYSSAFYAVACIGLHMKASNEGLFEKRKWQRTSDIKFNMKAIEMFLWKEIR